MIINVSVSGSRVWVGAGEDVGGVVVCRGVWGILGCGFAGCGKRRAGICAAEFEFADLRGLEFTGVHILCAEKHQKTPSNFTPECSESAKFGTKIQVRVVCPKTALTKKRRKPQFQAEKYRFRGPRFVSSKTPKLCGSSPADPPEMRLLIIRVFGLISCRIKI